MGATRFCENQCDRQQKKPVIKKKRTYKYSNNTYYLKRDVPQSGISLWVIDIRTAKNTPFKGAYDYII